MASLTTVAQLWNQVDLSAISLSVLAVAGLFAAVYGTMRGADFVLLALTGLERVKPEKKRVKRQSVTYRRVPGLPDLSSQSDDVMRHRAWREWQ